MKIEPSPTVTATVTNRHPADITADIRPSRKKQETKMMNEDLDLKLVAKIRESLWLKFKRRQAEFTKSRDRAAFELQPNNGSCLYLVSLDFPEVNALAGYVSIYALPLAAKLIARGSHVVATAEQIAEYLKLKADSTAQFRKGVEEVTTSPIPCGMGDL